MGSLNGEDGGIMPQGIVFAPNCNHPTGVLKRVLILISSTIK